MLFVRSDKLKEGMRLARPIYNKNGVLLYERNSKLTRQGMESIKNFGLIGIFVLEPAEPVPPMTAEDIEFERFQTMTVFALQEELGQMLGSRKQQKLQSIVSSITRNYGHLDKKVNFIQNLRGREDYIYKHALNVAILCALIGHRLNIRIEEQLDTITAALVHGIGCVSAVAAQKDKPGEEWLDEEDMRILEKHGFALFDDIFATNAGIKRICTQCRKALDDLEEGADNDGKMTMGAKIMLVAKVYDRMTAMNYGKEPASEVAALRYLMEHEEYFPEKIVLALTSSIHILAPGTSVELNTGEKGLVLVSNEEDILRPVVLEFNGNSIVDLSNERVYGDLAIQDIMKTMDNRHIIDIETLRAYGYRTEEAESDESGGDA